jgi:hypothetical protein
LVLEVASELVDQPEWRYRQARVALREQGGDGWPIVLFGSDSPAAIAQVASGEVQVALINPAAPLALALGGKGPFREPIALRAIAVIPSPDQLAFAVAKQAKANSLCEIRERRLPLRVSIRGQMDHSLHLVIKEVLSAFHWKTSLPGAGKYAMIRACPKDRTGSALCSAAKSI